MHGIPVFEGGREVDVEVKSLVRLACWLRPCI